MADKKVILFLTCEYYWAGSQKTSIGIYNEISKKYETHFCFFSIDDDRNTEFLKNAISLESRPSKNIFSKIINLIKRINKLRKIKSKLGITHTISFMDGANIVNVFSRIKKEVIITSIHGSMIYSSRISNNFLNYFYYKIFVSYFYNKSDYIVPISKELKKEIETKFAINSSKCYTIENFYDYELYQGYKHEEVEPELQKVFNNYKTLITVGRVSLSKNISGLLEIFFKVRKQINTIKLIIIGEGDLLDTLIQQSLSNSLNVYNYQSNQILNEGFDIYFLGYKSNPHKYVARSTLFLFPSLTEGFPNALAEAMLVGAPVITSDCPTGPKEILCDDIELYNNENGIILPIPQSEQDFNLWSNKILELIVDDEQLTTIKENTQNRIKKFSKERAIEKWLNLLK